MHYDALLAITQERLQSPKYYPKLKHLHPWVFERVVPQLDAALVYSPVRDDRIRRRMPERYLANKGVAGVLHTLMIFHTFDNVADSRPPRLRCLPWLVSPDAVKREGTLWHKHAADEFHALQPGYRPTVSPDTVSSFTLSFESGATLILSNDDFSERHRQAVGELAGRLGQTAVWIPEAAAVVEDQCYWVG